MARRSIAWILEFTSNLPSVEEKIKCLRANNNGAILTILKYCFDPKIEWDLPEGAPPYQPCPYPDVDNMLYAEARRLYLFVKGGNTKLSQHKREAMFIDLLQSVAPEDAKLLISIKDKRMPYQGLTAEIVKKAYPELW